jgi:hypothetical protein
VYRKPEDSPTFCPLPFIGIYYRGDDGGISNCCIERHPSSQHPTISEFNNDIQEYFTSPEVREKRRKMLAGEWPKGCDSCRIPESNGASSPRKNWKWMYTIANDLKLKTNTNEIYDLDYGTVVGKPLYFDYRPDNICNLGCAMCSPNASSILEKMVTEYPELNTQHVLQNTIDYTHQADDRTEIELTGLSNDTLRIKLNGGEPTISKKIKDLYAYIIDKDWAKNIELQFTTNFTNTNKTFYEVLPKFKYVAMTASLDGAGATYDYTRMPAHWEKIRQNILDVVGAEILPNYNFSINLVWSVSTIFTLKDWLPQLLDLMNDITNYEYTGKGIKNERAGAECNLFVNQCYAPKWQSLSVVPDAWKQKVLKDLLKIRKEYDPKPNTKLWTTFEQLAVGLKQFPFDKNHLTLWQNHVKIYDMARGTDITKLHPKYSELLNYDRS